MLSGREAEAVLGRLTGLGPRHARRVLAAGLAGEPVTSGRIRLYDPDTVVLLAKRPVVPEHEVQRVAPDLLVLRRDVPVTAA